MRSKVVVMLIVLNLFFQSCDDCNDKACFTPPTEFLFEIVDNDTKENLFTNGTFASNNITVTNLTENSNIEFDFIEENDSNLIKIYSIGWETEQVNAQISVSDTEIFNLVVDAKRVSEDCCSFTKYNSIDIENTTFELDEESGVYRIFVNQ